MFCSVDNFSFVITRNSYCTTTSGTLYFAKDFVLMTWSTPRVWHPLSHMSATSPCYWWYIYLKSYISLDWFHSIHIEKKSRKFIITIYTTTTASHRDNRQPQQSSTSFMDGYNYISFTATTIRFFIINKDSLVWIR